MLAVLILRISSHSHLVLICGDIYLSLLDYDEEECTLLACNDVVLCVCHLVDDGFGMFGCGGILICCDGDGV